MAYPQYFDNQKITREPSSYYASSGPNFPPNFGAFGSGLDQKGRPYTYSYNAPYKAQSNGQPRVLADTPVLNDIFNSPAFKVTRPPERTASPAPAQPQWAPTTVPDHIVRSTSSPEQLNGSTPPQASAQSEQARSFPPPEPTPSAPLKKSNSAQAALATDSQNEEHIPQQNGQPESAPDSSPKPSCVPLFPQPQHHVISPPHANSIPPNFHFSNFSDNHQRSSVTNQPRSRESSGPQQQRRMSNALTARDIRPDMRSFEAMLHSLQDFSACKEIFEGMSSELDQLNTRKGELETGLIAETNALREASTEALQSAERLVNSYDGFARALDRRLAEIAHSHPGGMLFPCEDIDVLSQEITLSVSALEHHVGKMQDRVRGLLTMIDELKDKRDRLEQRRKIWSWLERALAFLSTVLTAGACLAPLAGPFGIIAGAVMAGAAPLCAALSALCKKQADSLTEEKKLDNFLIFLRENLLTEAKAAEVKLTSFPPIQLVHTAALNAHADTSRGWISSEEANRARVDWSEWFRRFDSEKSSKKSSKGQHDPQKSMTAVA